MKNERYEESFKTEAVNLALSSELSYAEVARDLGLKYNTLYNWIDKAMSESHTKPSQSTKPLSNLKSKASKPDYQALERELKAARKELGLRKKEIEILKKAAAYFANMS